MIYHANGDWHQMTRITGPTHNLLGLVLVTAPHHGRPSVEVLGNGEAQVRPEIVREVQNGIRKANAELGTHYAVSRIRYVASDTPSEGVYEMLAQALVRRVQEESGREPLRATN
jgi:hypothetical protein